MNRKAGSNLGISRYRLAEPRTARNSREGGRRQSPRARRGSSCNGDGSCVDGLAPVDAIENRLQLGDVVFELDDGAEIAGRVIPT